MYEVYDRQKEIGEAIRAGERALGSLRDAERQLNSAGNWGLLDIFGGDTVSGLMKHLKINNASKCVESARRDLEVFRDELGDIQEIENLNVDVGGFLTFADFFFMDFWQTSSFSRRSVTGRSRFRKPSGEWRIFSARCGRHSNRNRRQDLLTVKSTAASTHSERAIHP